MSIEITVLISLLCAVGGFTLSYAAHRRTSKKEASEDGKVDGIMLTELGYIKSRVDDIKQNQKLQEERYVQLAIQITSVEAAAKQAHKRLDAFTGKTYPGGN